MSGERQRKFEWIISYIRWPVFLAAWLSVAGEVKAVVMLVLAILVFAWSLPAIRICSFPRLYEKYEWYPGILLRLIDVLLISWATHLLEPATPNLYLFYVFVIASTSLVYGWKPGLGSAAIVSVLYCLLLGHAGAFSKGGLAGTWFVARMGLFFLTACFVDFLVREAEREREARAALSRLRGLYEISSELMNEIDIDKLLRMILDLGIDQTDADRGSLMLAETSEDELTIRAARGLPEEVVRTARTKKGEGIAGYVFETGEPVMLGDLGRDSRFQHLAKNNQIISSLSVPISARGQTIGVLNVSSTGHREPFKDNDLKLLCLLAGQASASIQNSRMVAELKSLAETDGLTGLYNRRYLDRRLEAECRRAERHGVSLSIYIFDIDDFKKYNDTYGHLEGDDILRELSDLIKENVRTSDIPARYGGEEFLVILPHTDYEGAKNAADRLRATIENHRFKVERYGDHHLTVSGGVSTAHQGHMEVSDFLASADAALLQAKSQGKNRVYAAEYGHPAELVPVANPGPTDNPV